MAGKLTISRKWNNPKIETTITGEGILLTMNIDDFREALKTEIRSVTWIFKKETFDKMLDKAIQNTNGTFGKILYEAIKGTKVTFHYIICCIWDEV